MEKKTLKIGNYSLWRIATYFILYSVMGFIIETLFALINYKVLESRRCFLYGPFLRNIWHWGCSYDFNTAIFFENKS